MSLDLWMTIKECKHCDQRQESDSLNYTYNVAPMWYAIFPKDKHMVYIDGMTGLKASKKLNIAISRLKSNPDKFKALNPENGWGDYEGFVRYLEDILELCIKYPKGKWKASR